MTRSRLDSFLSSICDAAGMTGGAFPPQNDRMGAHPHPKGQGTSCQGPCAQAEWRAHLDIPGGLLCVCSSWSQGGRQERHRDIQIGINYIDKKGKPHFENIVLCDSEVRWLMETLWHAPIWDQ